jgi:thioesterase domain-containing protein
VWFRRTGDQEPLLCVHPGGGSAHWYEPLADRLPDDQPLVAFQYEGTARFPDGATAQELALHYLGAVEIPDSGAPVRLMGWCSGSPIAWEMARLLTEAGRPVILTLLDPVAPVTDLSDWLQDFQRCDELFTALCAGEYEPGEDEDRVRAKAFALLPGLIEGEEMPEDELTDAEWLQSIRGWHSLLKAILAYQYEAAHWPVNLIFSDEVASGSHEVVPDDGAAEYMASWYGLLAGTTYTQTTIPYDHYEVMREPQVKRLAEVLTTFWGARE